MKFFNGVLAVLLTAPALAQTPTYDKVRPVYDISGVRNRKYVLKAAELIEHVPDQIQRIMNNAAKVTIAGDLEKVPGFDKRLTEKDSAAGFLRYGITTCKVTIQDSEAKPVVRKPEIGVYVIEPGGILRELHYDETVLHEYGHGVNFLFGLLVNREERCVPLSDATEFRPVYEAERGKKFNSEKAGELFADRFVDYYRRTDSESREKMRRRHPEAYTHFKRLEELVVTGKFSNHKR